MAMDIGCIGVVGAGNMGSGIAQKYASEGFFVTLVDVNADSIAHGRERIETTLNEGVKRKVFSEAKKEEILSRLSFTTELEELAHAQLIIEAVYEDNQIKKDLFTRLDSICAPHAIFATNTSSFYVSDLAQSTKYPERFIGLHYFFHPAKNKLVEVIPGPRTNAETFTNAWKIQEKIGKLPVKSKDAPGFIVNRFFVPWLNEAMRLVDEKRATIASVEAAAKQTFGIGMGPFELMNVTGVPITFHAAKTLAQELGEFYQPSPLILEKVADKTGWDLTGSPIESSFAEISSRLLGVVFAIATQIVFEEKICIVEDCDLSARVGLRWKKGPFELFSEIGIEQGLGHIDEVKQRYPSLKIPPELDSIARTQPLMPQFVESYCEDGVGFIILNRPDSLNALNETVVSQLNQQFQRMVINPNVRGIIIEGRGKAFVAGADTQFFVEQIKGKNIERIMQFAKQTQELFFQIDTCSKPVVCCIEGLALGGGVELALACDYIVATSKAAIGFPETGIGIYPGLGGTQRTPRRIGIPLTRWLVLTGDIIDAHTAHAVGLFDAVVSPTDLKMRALSLVQQKPANHEKSSVVHIPHGFDEIGQIFSAPLEDLLKENNWQSNASIQKSLRKMAWKAPLALLTADQLIRATASLPIPDGLDAELSGLSTIFNTKDALVGLSSINKERPIFNGN